jgi:fatty-acyl-CoA synthase
MDRGIGQWLYKHAQISGDRPALADKNRRVTYVQLNERTNQLAWSLREAGVRPGDRVAILALNSVAYMETVFAVAKLGAMSVPLNYRLSAAELAYNLSDSGAMTLIYSTELADLARRSLEDPSVRQLITLEIGDPGADGYEGLLVRGSTNPLNSHVNPDDEAMILYTSGTTGRPKGAVLTHGAVLANSHHALLMGAGMSRYDVTVTPAPLFHVGGLAVHTLPLLYAGGFNYLLEFFDARETLAAMSREGATLQFLVPAMWAALTRLPDFEDYELKALRFVVSGGSPCPLTVIEFLQAHGWMFLDGFGMTETCASTMLIDAEHAVSKLGSVGRPLMHVDAKVVDDNDSEVRQGEVGELVLRGPNLFKGYWGLPEATDEAWRGGWFHTGDMAQVDADGFYTLVDRKKDMVITGGENVYPIEVEQVLHRHPQVQDVAVIGVPDERWGESVTAVVVPVEGESPSPEELIAYTRERLAHYKCPKRVEIVDELPRNATGKLLKRVLRKTYTGTTRSFVR